MIVERNNRWLEWIAGGLVAIYFVIALYSIAITPLGGDEGYFFGDLNLVISKGWMAAIEKKISIPHMLIIYPLSFIMKPELALRMGNLVIGLVLLHYFYRIAKVRVPGFYIGLFFYLATTRLFFAGINDPLFSAALIIFFSEVFFLSEDGKMNSAAWAFSGLIVAFFTREIIYIYLPVILLSLFIIYKKGFRISRELWIPVILFLLLLCFNIPSIAKNGWLSYDNKPIDATHSVNWSQRQYLAQLMVNEGKLPNFNHPSWEQTVNYVKEHGPDSLPRTTLESITHDPKLTVTEFVKNAMFCIIYGFRQLGLMLLIPIYFLIARLVHGRGLSYAMYLPGILLLMVSAFSFIIISFVELRWLMSVFICSILFYWVYAQRGRWNMYFLTANYLVLIALSLFGIYGLAGKL